MKLGFGPQAGLVRFLHGRGFRVLIRLVLLIHFVVASFA